MNLKVLGVDGRIDGSWLMFGVINPLIGQTNS
jgi:hypothetical protein